MTDDTVGLRQRCATDAESVAQKAAAPASAKVRDLTSQVTFRRTEQWRKDCDDERSPDGIHGQVCRLPSLERRKLAVAAHEAAIQPQRPPEIHEQDDILPERRHLVGAEAELRNTGGDRNQRDDIDDQRSQQDTIWSTSNQSGCA